MKKMIITTIITVIFSTIGSLSATYISLQNNPDDSITPKLDIYDSLSKDLSKTWTTLSSNIYRDELNLWNEYCWDIDKDGYLINKSSICRLFLNNSLYKKSSSYSLEVEVYLDYNPKNSTVAAEGGLIFNVGKNKGFDLVGLSLIDGLIVNELKPDVAVYIPEKETTTASSSSSPSPTSTPVVKIEGMSVKKSTIDEFQDVIILKNSYNLKVEVKNKTYDIYINNNKIRTIPCVEKEGEIGLYTNGGCIKFRNFKYTCI